MDYAASTHEKLALPPGYPAAFSRLWADHLFTAFDAGGVRVFGNTRSGDDESFADLLSDGTLTAALLAARFLPFGRPVGGSYDRICFDVRGRINAEDAPVVRMDHESILSFSRIPKPIAVADGLAQLLRQ